MFVAESTLVMGQISQRVSVDSGFTPLIDSYQRDDIASANANNALIPAQRSLRRQAANLDFSAGYASVPSLAVAIHRAGPIAFSYWLIYSTSDVNEGAGVRLAFSGSANGIAYSIQAYTDANTQAPLVTASNFGTAIPAFSTGPGSFVPGIIRIAGSCEVTTVGELNLQVRTKSTGTSTLQTGSWCEVLSL